MIWLLVLCALVTHTIKIFRFYFFLIDKKISFRKFVAIYAATSALNIIIPFKLGELFRLAAIGLFIKCFRTTLLAIFTERFFDSIIVLCILIAAFFKYQFQYPIMVFVLALLVVGLYTAYKIAFPITSNLQLYIMLKKNSRYDKKVLQILDSIGRLHSIEVNILKTNGHLIFILTLAAWFFDILAMSIALLETNINVGLYSISMFLYELTSFNRVNLFSLYVIVNLSVLTVIFLGANLILRKQKKRDFK